MTQQRLMARLSACHQMYANLDTAGQACLPGSARSGGRSGSGISMAAPASAGGTLSLLCWNPKLPAAAAGRERCPWSRRRSHPCTKSGSPACSAFPCALSAALAQVVASARPWRQWRQQPPLHLAAIYSPWQQYTAIFTAIFRPCCRCTRQPSPARQLQVPSVASCLSAATSCAALLRCLPLLRLWRQQQLLEQSPGTPLPFSTSAPRH